MIYLQRTTTAENGAEYSEIAAVEDERSAMHYEALGYQRCSFEAFREAWRLRDLRSLAMLRAAFQVAAAPRGIYPATS